MTEKTIGILAYADDVVLLSENDNELQQLMNELNVWCEHNKLEVNVGKSKVIHFRTQSKPRTIEEFRCAQNTLEIVNQYVYLGLLLMEHLDYLKMSKHITNSASRALDLLIQVTKFNVQGGYRLQRTLNYTTVQY